jgi:hypothetical protein
MDANASGLPPELAKQSISQASLVLPLDAALQAIALLTQNGRRLEQWEGWVRLRDGSRTKSLTHGGSFALSNDPDYPGAELYFGLTFVEALPPT